MVKLPKSNNELELQPRNQKYPRGIFRKPDFYAEAPISIIKYAFKTEAAAKAMEKDNTLIFAVDVRATKPQIKEAVSKLYNAKVKKVNTLITFKHYIKKAFVRFADEGKAVDIANQAGIL